MLTISIPVRISVLPAGADARKPSDDDLIDDVTFICRDRRANHQCILQAIIKE